VAISVTESSFKSYKGVHTHTKKVAVDFYPGGRNQNSRWIREIPKEYIFSKNIYFILLC
jgi:phage anti-repressor protein